MILFTPYGIATGYVSVTLGYTLTHAGVSVADVATVVAIGLVPQTWKVLWAPIIDTTLTRKRWYLMAALATGLGIAATGLVPADNASLTLIRVLVFGFNLMVSFLTMSVESLLAHATPEAKRGKAGGWLQAGNLGGLGLGGGLGLWVAHHIEGTWLPGTLLGVVCLACALALAAVHEPAAERGAVGPVEAVKEVGRDVWSVMRSRLGFLAMVLLFMPIGTGAAANLFADIAGDWQADADTVALVNGMLSGLISIAGCLFGGYLSDAMDYKTAYSVCGVTLALCAIAMGLAPHTAMLFVAFTCLYNFITGIAYATFTAVALEAIGKGAVATKYNLMACLSNVPILYMTTIDGAVQTAYGSTTMLLAESVLGFVGIGLYLLIALATRRLTVGRLERDDIRLNQPNV